MLCAHKINLTTFSDCKLNLIYITLLIKSNEISILVKLNNYSIGNLMRSLYNFDILNSKRDMYHIKIIIIVKRCILGV